MPAAASVPDARLLAADSTAVWPAASSHPLGAPRQTTPPEVLMPRTPSPPFVAAPPLRDRLWRDAAPRRESFMTAFVWPELPDPWGQTASLCDSADPFVRPPTQLPPNPLAPRHRAVLRPATAARHVRLAPVIVPKPDVPNLSRVPIRPTVRPEPLWPPAAPIVPALPSPSRRKPHTLTPAPARVAARPRLVASTPVLPARAPPCLKCSLHPIVDAAAALLLQPRIVTSVQQDAARALAMLGPAPPTTRRTVALSAAQQQTSLWRGLALARLSDPAAKDALLRVLRDNPRHQAALAHLLGVLIYAPGVGAEGQPRTLAEGYVNLALADYPDDPFVRLCAALLARQVGDAVRCRQMLLALTQAHAQYGPGLVALAALDAASFAQDADAKLQKSAMGLCKQNLALAGHRDMALCLIDTLVNGRIDGACDERLKATMQARYGRMLARVEDVLQLPLVVLDPSLPEALGDDTSHACNQALSSKTS